MNDNKSVDELVISYLFPPSRDVSGMVLAKRFIVDNKHFDVIQANVRDDLDLEFKRAVDDYINEQIVVDISCNSNNLGCIFRFIKKSMAELDKRKVYDRIYSRVWKLPNNFLAFEYKLKHPEVYWTAEFSDPMLYDTLNRKRFSEKKLISNEEYLSKINKAILNLNDKENTDFKLLESRENVYFLVEYLAYLFADEIVFTNVNQRKVMLDQFPVDVKDFVEKKSAIKEHPILPKEYYNLKDFKEDLDSSKINLGYFGNIYSKRHFESVFQAFEKLNHKHKDSLQFYFYINDKNLFEKLTSNLEISENIHIKDQVDYLDFLNLINKFDVLIINDLITSDCFEVNPYRPSKLSDYLGSDSKIWAICERGSILDSEDVEYKSFVDDYKSSIDALADILNDHSLGDENYGVIDDDEYLLKRITELNVVIAECNRDYKRINSSLDRLKKKYEKLEAENKELKEKNDEILSSNSWKLTGFLRRKG